MTAHRTRITFVASLGVLGAFCFLVLPGHAEEPEASPAGFTDGVSTANEVLADTFLVGGAASVDRLRTLVMDDQPDGHAYEILVYARLLRALGRTEAAFEARWRAAAEKADDPEVRAFARAAGAVLATATPLGKGREDGGSISPRKLVAALTDGNEHRVANNVLVDQLLLHGQAAIPVVLDAVLDPAFEGRGYAAWAASVLVRGTAADPRLVRPALEMATTSRDAYVRTLAKSALDILSEEESDETPAAVKKPNPYIVRANAEAPGPDAPVGVLVRAMQKRGSNGREIVLDRLIARGALTANLDHVVAEWSRIEVAS